MTYHFRTSHATGTRLIRFLTGWTAKLWDQCRDTRSLWSAARAQAERVRFARPNHEAILATSQVSFAKFGFEPSDSPIAAGEDQRGPEGLNEDVEDCVILAQAELIQAQRHLALQLDHATDHPDDGQDHNRRLIARNRKIEAALRLLASVRDDDRQTTL